MLYCIAVLVRQPQSNLPASIGGIVVGAVFLWLTGVLLLWLLAKRRFSGTALAVGGILLFSLDQLAKLAVLTWLPHGTFLPLVEEWLTVRFVPNHQNNVLFNLLGITMPSRWLDAGIKLFAMALLVLFILWYARKQKIAANGHMQAAAVLMVAAGASSVLDTALRGYVLDFISIDGLVAFDFKDLYLQWAIGLFVIAFIQEERRQSAREKATAGEGSPPPAA